MRKAEPIRREKGRLVLDPSADAANADWLRALRLKVKADEGDKEAAQDLEKLESTTLYED